jgi:hypothetical protein
VLIYPERAVATLYVCSMAEKHRELCTPLAFVIPACVLAIDSRISMRAARHAPESP